MAKRLRLKFLVPLCFVLAWFFDYFFWGKVVGVSFPLFTILLVAAGLWMAWRNGLRPARNALWLLVPIAFLALVSVFRTEPLTLFTSRALVVVLLGVFALSFLGGQWTQYGFADYIAKLLGLIPNGLTILRESGKPTGKKTEKGFNLRSLAPVARGLLLALPLLWFLTVLLSSADPFFSQWFGDLFNFMKIDNAGEYVWRGLIIFVLGYCFAGIYMYAFVQSKNQTLFDQKQPVLAVPRLGFGEALTMLTSVNLLFAAFVVVQFRYFFGGLANIVEGPSGMTFAEYARRGFGELVVVAITALLFFVVLSSISLRKAGSQRTWFSGLGIGLFVLVAVILVSSFERLLLLEQAYGFTRLRTYPHVFMIWLGILLLAIVVLELVQRQRAFALAVLFVVVGFTASLAVLNVDGFIVRSNIAKVGWGVGLDFRYLGSLSDDAVPSLAQAYRAAVDLGDASHAEQIAMALTCHFARRGETHSRPWQSWTLSAYNVEIEWRQLTERYDFSEFQIVPPDYVGQSPAVMTEDGPINCSELFWD